MIPFALLLLLPRCVADYAQEQVFAASLLNLDQRKTRTVRREAAEEAPAGASAWKPQGPKFILADSFLELDFQREAPEGSVAAAPAVEREKSWVAVYTLVVVMLVAIGPIAVKEGLRPFATVVMYLACLSLVKMWVKETMNEGFAYPDSITAAHMFCTSLAAASFERPRLSEAFMVLPISVVNGASLLTNNTALLYGGVAFVTMVSSCTPMLTFFLELFKKRRGLDFLTTFSVILVCSGSAFCVRGEKTASVFAFLFAMAAALLRSMKGVWQHELLTISVSPMRLVFWSGFWSFWITITMMALSEGTQAFRHVGTTMKPEAKNAFLCSIAAAVALNIVQCVAVEQLGALLQSIVGNLNLILVIALSQAWLREQVSPSQYVGVLMLAIGTFVNKMGGKKPPPPEKEASQASQVPPAGAAQRLVEKTPSEATTEGDYGATDSASVGTRSDSRTS